MNWRIILAVIVFLISVAGLFYAGYLLAKLLEDIFHIHLL
jgi:hypothetical protein